MKRLSLAMLLTLLTWLVSPVWGAAQEGKTYRIGYLSLAPIADSPSPERAAFFRALRELGYVEGRNLIVEYRSAEANIELLPDAATDLVELKPPLIFAVGTPTALAAKQATQTIPIVMIAADPVENGLVPSLAKPGGNLTGLSLLDARLALKRLELLKEALPKASRVAVLWTPAHPAHMQTLPSLETRAKELGLTLQTFEVTRTAELQEAFKRMSAARPDAILVLTDYRTLIYRALIAEFAAKNGLPTMFGSPESVRAGGLMSYGVSIAELFTRAARFVDRILNGAQPASLPVEQPSRFDLVVNRKTAKILELEFPESFLLRATVFVE
jgi:putative ABC transport system substrate-binding protein